MIDLLIDLLSKTISIPDVNYATLATKLIENGLIYIPFKLGDIVYVIVDKTVVVKGKIIRISIDKKGDIRFVVDRPKLNSPYDTSGTYKLSSIGKTIFLDEVEANEFLKGCTNYLQK